MHNSSSGTPAAFTPEAVAAINRAYLDACQIAAQKGAPDDIRFALAERLMFLARNGETDEHRLCAMSVSAVLGRGPKRDHKVRVVHDV